MKHKPLLYLIAFFFLIAAGYLYFAFLPSLGTPASPPAKNDPIYVARRQALEPTVHNRYTVHLVAKSSNEGKVHLWHELGASASDGAAPGGADPTFTDVSADASCQQLDNKRYQIQDGGPPIYYYKLACNGSVGYVEVDQVR